jgi:hypothetical protein
MSGGVWLGMLSSGMANTSNFQGLDMSLLRPLADSPPVIAFSYEPFDDAPLANALFVQFMGQLPVNIIGHCILRCRQIGRADGLPFPEPRVAHVGLPEARRPGGAARSDSRNRNLLHCAVK